MTETGRASAGPIRLTSSSVVALRPATQARITGGLWAGRRAVNRDVCVPQGWDRLHEAGNFHNLELAAARVTGDYVNDLPFLDSDLYKWLEGVAWTLDDPDLAQAPAEELLRRVAESTELLTAVQQEDGYLNSHFQVRFPGERFVQLPWGHELYCAGHLIQAAVALHRSTGDEQLLGIDSETYLPIDDTGIPEGGPAPVQGTPFDLRRPTLIGECVRSRHPQVVGARGIDHNYLPSGTGWRVVATLDSPLTETRMELLSDQPGLQVYTGNGLDGVIGSTQGGVYRQGDGLALEPQLFPDSPNRPAFASPVLHPGETYRSALEWRFRAQS